MSEKSPTLKLIDFDWRLKSDENEQFWPKSKAIALVFWSNMSENSPTLKLIDFDCRLKSDENEAILAKK